jgi:hypothetical protein
LNPAEGTDVMSFVFVVSFLGSSLRGADHSFSSVGIATGYGLDGPGIEFRWGEIFRTCPDRPWGPPGTMGTGSFPEVKRLGRGADHPPPSSAEVEKEESYTSTPPLGLRVC